MGYTHYFTQLRTYTAEEWEQLTEAVRDMLREEHAIDTLAGWDGDNEPEISDTEIAFNGRADRGLDHETFRRANAVEPEGFSFCKTQYKPYDSYVVATLVLSDLIAPGVLELNSDGTPQDWRESVDRAPGLGQFLARYATDHRLSSQRKHVAALLG